jgi:DHA1 family bicyclomycin/chloramphenicol resistance-like MFS transporter
VREDADVTGEERVEDDGSIAAGPPVSSARRTQSAGSAPRPTGHLARRIRLGLIIGSLSALAPLSFDLYIPALPELTREFGVSASEAQLTLTACLVGLGLGQILFGPLSDRLGRRPPLLAGLGVYCAASLACALAQSLYGLVALRFVQGLAGASGIVIARAIVRDLRSGSAAARLFSYLMLVTGLAPILAPIVGSQLLRATSWRGLFVTLTAIGFVLLLASALGLGETLPAERRRRERWRHAARPFVRVLRDRIFVGYALVLSAAFGEMFSYIAGSSYVLQDIYGVSPQLYGGIFGLNALGLTACGQINALLIGRVSIRRLLAFGVIMSAAAGLGLVAVVIGEVGLAGILPCLFTMVASAGFILPNATALALRDHPLDAGTASALLGGLSLLTGAVVAPLAGVAGSSSALPMAVLMGTLGLGGVVALASTLARHGARPVVDG